MDNSRHPHPSPSSSEGARPPSAGSDTGALLGKMASQAPGGNSNDDSFEEVKDGEMEEEEEAEEEEAEAEEKEEEK